MASCTLCFSRTNHENLAQSGSGTRRQCSCRNSCAHKPYPVVATTSGALELLEIQLPGKKRCDATALVNGFQLTVGESLNFSPDES